MTNTPNSDDQQNQLDYDSQNPYNTFNPNASDSSDPYSMSDENTYSSGYGDHSEKPSYSQQPYTADSGYPQPPQQQPYPGQQQAAYPGMPQQQPYGQQPPAGYYAPGQPSPGESAANTSMVWGIVGLVANLIIGLAGLVCGPVALHYAKKAENMGAKATAGKVTGWIALIWSILGMLAGIAALIFFIFVFNEAVNYEYSY